MQRIALVQRAQFKYAIKWRFNLSAT